MKQIFYCPKCKHRFSAKGKEIVWHDRRFGPCRKTIAKCPKCKKQASPYRPKSTKSAKKHSLSNLSCATGKCPFVN